MKHLVILLNIFISFQILGSTLKPITFDRQLKRASGVIFGTFLGNNIKKTKDGTVITEASFKIKKVVGIEERSVINRKLFKVYYDGGVWNGVKFQNNIAPTFSVGKDYVVIVKDDANGFKVAEGMLGVYAVERKGAEKFVVSQAFPNDSDIGVTKVDQFDVWVKIAYGSYLQEIQSDKYIFKSRTSGGNRSPATISDQEKASNSSNIHILWYVLAIGAIGAFHIRSRKS